MAGTITSVGTGPGPGPGIFNRARHSFLSLQINPHYNQQSSHFVASNLTYTNQLYHLSTMNTSASSAFREPLLSHDFLAQELGAGQFGAVEGGEVREQGSDNGAHVGLFSEDEDEKDESNEKDRYDELFGAFDSVDENEVRRRCYLLIVQSLTILSGGEGGRSARAERQQRRA